jgi:hypothetical protein
VEAHYQSRRELVLTGLVANEKRIAALVYPSQHDAMPRSQQDSVENVGRLAQSRMSEASSPSYRLLARLHARLGSDLQFASATSTVNEAMISWKGTDAHHHEAIARLVKAHWRYRHEHHGFLLDAIISWEVGDFVAEYLGGDVDLKAVLTVTGNAHGAYSTTCRQ